MMEERTDILIEDLRKELRKTRIFNCVVSALLVCVLVGAGFVAFRVHRYVQKTQPLLERLEEVDYTMINDTLESIDWEQLQEQMNAVDWKGLSEQVASVDWKEVADQINAVDWEALSDQLEAIDVDALNAAIEGLDTETLTKTLENINEAAERINKLGDSWKSLFGKIGIGN